MFEKKHHNSFTIVEVPGRPPLQLTIVKVGGNTDVIEVKSDKDCVHVPLTNVSGIYYFNAADAENEKIKNANKAAAIENSKNAKDTAPRPI